MMIFFNNLVSVFYDLRLITFLTLLLDLIIFMDYQSQADPHKNKIENLKMVISNNIYCNSVNGIFIKILYFILLVYKECLLGKSTSVCDKSSYVIILKGENFNGTDS